MIFSFSGPLTAFGLSTVIFLSIEISYFFATSRTLMVVLTFALEPALWRPYLAVVVLVTI